MLRYLHTFDSPDGSCIVIHVMNMTRRSSYKLYKLSDDTNHIKMHCKIVEIIVRKNENVLFYKTFFNIDIASIFNTMMISNFGMGRR